MFNIGPGELIVIVILALVLLGPDKLPEVARTVGKGMRELRRATEDIRSTVEEELYRADLQKPVAPPAAGPAVPRVQGTLERLPPASSEPLATPWPVAEPFPPPAGTQPEPTPTEAAGVHPVEPPTSAKS